MKDEEKICKKCKKTYFFLSSGCSLCVDCVKKYPYFLTFIEEGFDGIPDRAFGRVEARSNKEPAEYTKEEIRFLFKDNQRNTSKKRKEFQKFREKWDFKNVSETELEEVKRGLEKSFYNKDL